MSEIFYTDEKGFPTEFDIKPVMPEMKFWKTQCNIHYIADKFRVIVPIGFETDGASIPEFLQPIVGGMWGPYGPAAIVHDYGYKYNKHKRKVWDGAMFIIMTLLGVDWLTKRKIYWGIRAGGWYTWNKYREGQK